MNRQIAGPDRLHNDLSPAFRFSSTTNSSVILYSVLLCFDVHALPDLPNGYVSEGLTHVEFFAFRN